MTVLQPAYRDGDGKEIVRLSFDATRAAILASGLVGQAELDEIGAELRRFLDDPKTIVSAPRVFQVMGRRPL